MHCIRVAFGLSTLALLVAGCGALSEHPLTDDKTSVLDERLIGVWEFVPEKGEDGKPDGEPKPRLYIGRLEDRPNTLEAVVVGVEKQKVKVQRMDLFATKLSALRYASVGKDDTYVILLYDLEQADQVTLYAMNEDVIEAAIKKGVLTGEVEVSEGKGFIKIKTKTIRIKATPDKLAAWLRGYSPACYMMDKPLKLRRIVFEDKATSEPSASPPPPPPPPPGEDGP